MDIIECYISKNTTRRYLNGFIENFMELKPIKDGVSLYYNNENQYLDLSDFQSICFHISPSFCDKDNKNKKIIAKGLFINDQEFQIEDIDAYWNNIWIINLNKMSSIKLPLKTVDCYMKRIYDDESGIKYFKPVDTKTQKIIVPSTQDWNKIGDFKEFLTSLINDPKYFKNNYMGGKIMISGHILAETDTMIFFKYDDTFKYMVTD